MPDLHPVHGLVMMASKTALWSWLRGLPDGLKIALTMGTLVSAGYGIGTRTVSYRLERTRVLASAQTVARLDTLFTQHVQASAVWRGKIEDLEVDRASIGSAADSLRQGLRSLDDRLDSIECLLDLMLRGRAETSEVRACSTRRRPL